MSLKPVKQTLFDTKDSLQEAVAFIKDSLPITDDNHIHSLLMTYHNTLLMELDNGNAIQTTQ